MAPKAERDISSDAQEVTPERVTLPSDALPPNASQRNRDRRGGGDLRTTEFAPQSPVIEPAPRPQLPEIGAATEVGPTTESQQDSEGVDQRDDIARRRAAASGGAPAQQPAQQPATQQKTPTQKEIEQVLSEGLTQIYQSMTPQEQAAFRAKGEETTAQLQDLVTNFKATTRKVVKLIREWLKIIPGVNRYFLEQESKLKTDRIMKLQRRLKQDSRNRITPS